MVFTRGKVYKNHLNLQTNKGFSKPTKDSLSECEAVNSYFTPEFQSYEKSILELQEIIDLLAEINPFPVAIIDLESHQILFQNKLVNNPVFQQIIPDFLADSDLWTQLNSKLETGDFISNLGLEFKSSDKNRFLAIISGKIVNYENKQAVFLVFTDVNTVLVTSEEQQKDTLVKLELSHLIADPSDSQGLPTIQHNLWPAPSHLMEQALAATSNGIVLTDANQPDNPIIYVNPGFEAMTGYSASEVVGQNCRLLQAHETDQPGLSELRAALQEQKECHVIIKNFRKDGTEFWNELYIAPVFDSYGQLTHFIGIQNDITQHLQALETLQEQKEQYRRIVETASEGIWLLNRNNETTFVNQQMATMLGYTIEEMLGESLFSFMDAEGVDIAQDLLLGRRQGIQEKHNFKFRRKDGSDLWAIISCTPLFDEQGNYTGALGMLTNISDVYDELRLRKQAENALQESKERLDGILNSLEVVIWSIAADTFEILYLNSAVVQVYGRSVDEFYNNSNLWFELIHPEDQQRVNQSIKPLLANGSHELEYRILRQDGQVRWLYNHSHVIYDAVGQPIRIEGVATDITERKNMEERLVYHAFYDDLTGLPNRVLFMDRLAQTINQAKESPNDLFAVLFLDLDRFKVVNDSLSHLVGDQLLVSFAQRLQSCLQPEDTLARLGGDEFAILLSHIQSIDDATHIAEKIHQALKLPFNLSGYEVFTTVSIGIAFSTNDYIQAADLLRDADTALYCAKEQGKAWHIVFDSTMYDRAVALLQLETDLRWAIARQELYVVYQPIVSVATGKITGFEALVRWEHPERGLISPVEFIPVAEETGLIIQIGQFVLRESCQQLKQWHLEFPEFQHLSINVNLSGKQFSQPYLVEEIEQLLQEFELDANSIKLEITESAIMASPEQAATILQQLKTLGIQLCIDDFGTGYSSLAYLHCFPIDVLKIDRSFTKRIDSDSEQLAIIRAIVTLANNLEMSVVAEGVETVNQLVQLQLLKCDQAQGYLFSKPLSSDKVSLLLAAKIEF
ncbi:sensor domain-containing protein [Nostoc parmelioides]|uniref:EAL domain-containing protein n=1 Tax=Nostoc parmelioides FACHB-3921 TaxID=2692909 RepID=A0ABR8BM84_9NOSO|nr:bifunctional diguanylate cyclase/phosphodiesterase [Nostoc parmelioides]MBD2254347.1 EAL domain-containing protein [Nostoc parmelioides FACHB-3921]